MYTQKPAHGCRPNSFIWKGPNLQADKESTLALQKVEDASVARANELSGHGREEKGNQIHTVAPSR